jgi:hypothetical protein
MSVLWFLQQAKGKTADEIDKHIDAPLHMEVALCTDRWCVIHLNCCAQFNLKCCFAQGGLGTAKRNDHGFLNLKYVNKGVASLRLRFILAGKHRLELWNRTRQ